ncbi:hypothetical protein GGTG_00330 [Gaeumannomyces tritici R3-111a-1]|uniref:Uncharacterized protein n=1 Tax=Gaeumannomyces tritici (strain R3-111a-1) TaxID=644352 RepID=J3NGD9_GAET3|nr:hypothetical protein GGTG_00330 [Gaeumannomyces tritici R3-111a-1]EJT80329.1 hypothetical protein GGTG_00330 [Gaeumannomyces tritici R3-111a-1]
MFLHSGASLHGHEYSNRPAPGAGPALNRRSPLLRSPFSAPLARSNTAPPSALQSRYAPPQPGRPAQTPQPQQQPLQSCLPQKQSSRLRWSTAEEPVVRFQEQPELVDGMAEKHDSVLGPPSPAIISEDEGSCSEASEVGIGSANSGGRSRRRRKPRLPRKSSLFFLARPAPKLVKKRLMKQLVRPKLLLQLHHLSVDKRPTPLLDIFPASTIAGPALGGRFAKRFPRVFGVTGDRSELGSQDVILLRSEEYCTADDCELGPVHDDDDEENLNCRELVAVLSPLRWEDRTEIVLDDGNVWVGESLANGSFEFTHTDAHGANTTARWVRRSPAKATTPSLPLANIQPCPDNSSPWATSVDEYKYTFSIIDPLSRRHPIMATLTPNTLDVLENYTTVSSSYGKYPPSRPFGHGHGHGASSDEEEDDEEGGAPLPKPERQSKPVDAATRNIISITAVWVTLRLGGIMPASTERTMSLRSGGASRARNGSMNGGPKPPTSRSGTPSAAAGREDTATPGPQTPAVGGGASLLPRRATSTGAAFVQRRMQMSDASDSERAVAGAPSSGLRSKGRRVLSGDWNVSSWKRSSTPQPTTSTAAQIVGMSPVPPREPQSPRKDHSSTWPHSSGGVSLLGSRPGSAQPASDLVATQARSDRRAQPTLYGAPPTAALEAAGLVGLRNHATSTPGPVDPNSPAGALAALEGGVDASAVAGGPGVDNAARPEKGWKRLSGWLRRFGR